MDSVTRELVDGIEGWLSGREMEFLYSTAGRVSSEGAILEIGAFVGKSTVCLARAAESRGGRIVSIDPHMSDLEHALHHGGVSSYEQFLANLRAADVDQIVTPVVAKSQEYASSWNGPISFLWIDGDHTLEGARADFELYSPYLIEGAVVAFHDATQEPLPALVTELLSRPGYRRLGLADSIAYATRADGRRKSPRDHVILWVLRNWGTFRRFKFMRDRKVLLKGLLASWPGRK